MFTFGSGLGAALVSLRAAVLAIFFYIPPDVGASFTLIAYVAVTLGGIGSIFGAFVGGILVGLVEASTATILPPALKAVRVLRGFPPGRLHPAARPVRCDLMATKCHKAARGELIAAFSFARSRPVPLSSGRLRRTSSC